MAIASTSPAADPPSPRRGGLRLALRLAVSAALIAWILAKTPFREVAAAFRSADPRFVLLALALNPIGYFASGSRRKIPSSISTELDSRWRSSGSRGPFIQ